MFFTVIFSLLLLTYTRFYAQVPYSADIGYVTSKGYPLPYTFTTLNYNASGQTATTFNPLGLVVDLLVATLLALGLSFILTKTVRLV